MSALLRLSPLVLAAAATGCTVTESDRPYRADGVPSTAIAHAAAEMGEAVRPGQFVARVGALPLGGHDANDSAGEHAAGVAHDAGLHGAARLEPGADGHLVYLDADGFAVRIEVMLPETAFANRLPDADADVPPAPAPVAGGIEVDVEEAGDATAKATAEAAASLADEDAGLTVLQTYAGPSRLRATVIVNGERMDSQSGELHLRTVRDDRLRGWFYFDVKPLTADGLDNETERVYGAFDAAMTPGMAAARASGSVR